MGNAGLTKEVKRFDLERPHSTSYFSPGRVEWHAVQTLVYRGCTTIFISKQVFDRLPNLIQACLAA